MSGKETVMSLSPFCYCCWTLAISTDGQQMSFFFFPLSQRCASRIRGAVWVVVQDSWSPEPGVKLGGGPWKDPGGSGGSPVPRALGGSPVL